MRLVWKRHVNEYSPAKTVEYPKIFPIGHSRISLNLFLKASLGAHPFIWNHSLANETHFHMSGCAPGLALMERLRWTRKRAIFKTARVAKTIWRIVNTIAPIWGENMLGYLSLDIICSSQAHSSPRATLTENCSLLGTDNVRGQIS